MELIETPARRLTVGVAEDPSAALEWMADAVCRSADPDLFFLPGEAHTEQAAAVCQGCPVRRQCLEYAIDNGITAGVFGGLSPDDRALLLSPDHDCRTGHHKVPDYNCYNTHRCRCDGCTEANRIRCADNRQRAFSGV